MTTMTFPVLKARLFKPRAERAPSASPAEPPATSGLIDRVRQLNPSAAPEYLARFSAEALGLYIDHLETAAEPRGRGAGWVRPGDTRGIVGWRRSDDDI